MSGRTLIKDPIVAFGNSHIVDYPTPSNLNYLWSFGSMGGIVLVIQIISGILLAMHYTPHIDLAFLSLEYAAIRQDHRGKEFHSTDQP